jgi:hypothetical protein
MADKPQQNSLKKYLEFINTVNDTLEIKNFDMSPTNDRGNYYIALASDNHTQNYNSITSKMLFPLTHVKDSMFTITFGPAFDAYNIMEILCYPNEEISSVILSLVQDDNETILKTVDNVSGPFSFYEKPFYLCPTYSFKIDVIFSNITSIYNRFIWIGSSLFSTETRKEIEVLAYKIMLDTYVPSQKEITETLKEHRYCPECNDKASHVCNCEKRDSICPRGHKWYYNKRENKILKGNVIH